jgi:multiple sugar transport system ATP-binding protein
MVYVTHDQTEAMTLGDRVAIMRAGVLQQVAAPMELYNEPVNLFVAGFIGSPSMNFLPAHLQDGVVHLPMVDAPLPAARRERLGHIAPDKPLIAGIRPEDFEDAEVVGAAGEHGATFRARIDVLEAMGSEYYAHFTIDASRAQMAESEQLRELEADAGEVGMSGDGFDLVARLDQTSRVRAKDDAEVWMNTEKLHLFDPETGVSLDREAAVQEQGAPAR